jgi:hypothetical protein
MNALIAKAKTATTEQLFEMAMLLHGAQTREEMMARSAVTVALESRITGDEFDAFFAELDAS